MRSQRSAGGAALLLLALYMPGKERLHTAITNPSRSLLQVRINHVDEAEEVFSTLMGDIVEPRRDFIQENALKVANLDV